MSLFSSAFSEMFLAFLSNFRAELFTSDITMLFTSVTLPFQCILFLDAVL